VGSHGSQKTIQAPQVLIFVEFFFGGLPKLLVTSGYNPSFEAQVMGGLFELSC